MIKATNIRTERTPASNNGLAIVAVQCSAHTLVVKVTTSDKPETIIGNPNGHFANIQRIWFKNTQININHLWTHH